MTRALFQAAMCGVLAAAPACSEDSAAPLPTCEGKATPSTRAYDISVDMGGVTRHAAVRLPQRYLPDQAMPLVLSFHGLTSNAFEQEFLDALSDVGDDEGFIVVYPNGTGLEPSWNAGLCCGDASTNNVDDVAFVESLLDTLDEELCIDTSNVFATGMSNGGFFSYRLACDLAHRIAAVAPVAGGLVYAECAPSRPVSLLHFHGTADELVPYQGLPDLGLPTVPAQVESWAVASGCNALTRDTFMAGDASCTSHIRCPQGVDVGLCTIADGGHTWPGSSFSLPQLGKTSRDISASREIWKFFTQHPLPK